MMQLARRAFLVFPRDERILLDMAKYYMSRDLHEQAKQYCLEALAVNPDLDMSYETLAVIYDAQKDFEATVVNARRMLVLSPSGPMNQLNMGLALCDVHSYVEASHHLANAIEAYPSFVTDQPRYAPVLRNLELLRESGEMSDRLKLVIASLGLEYVHIIDGQPDPQMPAITSAPEAASAAK
jgi:tetratricopeptide (TPR) repeat protein